MPSNLPHTITDAQPNQLGSAWPGIGSNDTQYLSVHIAPKTIPLRALHALHKSLPYSHLKGHAQTEYDHT